jgi:hypothetical protein
LQLELFFRNRKPEHNDDGGNMDRRRAVGIVEEKKRTQLDPVSPDRAVSFLLFLNKTL